VNNFASIAKVKQSLPSVLVNGSVLQAFGGTVPIHMILHDREGNNLSVEYINGDLNMLDNPNTVYTNSPPLPYQLIAAGSDGNLNAIPPAEITLNGLALPPASAGTGLLGLPNDFLSTSRFIRSLIFSRNAPTNLSSAEQVVTAFHLLNQFDLPPESQGIPAEGGYGGSGLKATYEITK